MLYIETAKAVYKAIPRGTPWLATTCPTSHGAIVADGKNLLLAAQDTKRMATVGDFAKARAILAHCPNCPLQVERGCRPEGWDKRVILEHKEE